MRGEFAVTDLLETLRDTTASRTTYSQGADDDLTVESLSSITLAGLARGARRVSRGVMDHEDLLSEAILASVEASNDGRRPAYLRAYLMATMRNRVVDELRSARRRDLALSDGWGDRLVAPAAPGSLEWDEKELVRSALARMPEDQRRCLLRTVVDGCKPRELVAEFGRPATALSSLSQRARHSLRSMLMQVLFERCASRGHEGSDGGWCGQCEDVWVDLVVAYGGRTAAERAEGRRSQPSAA